VSTKGWVENKEIMYRWSRERLECLSPVSQWRQEM